MTKKLFKTFALLLVLPLSLLLVACNAGNTPPTTHKASTTWVKDANYHWHDCACGDSTCNISYDLAAHNWVDGETITTSVATITPQTCACGATNTKITQTEEQMYNSVLKVIQSYANGEKSFTITLGGEKFFTFDSGTFTSFDFEAEICYMQIDDEFWKITNSEDIKVTAQEAKQVCAEYINAEHAIFDIPTYAEFKEQSDATITKSDTGVYTLKVYVPDPDQPSNSFEYLIYCTDIDLLSNTATIQNQTIFVSVLNSFDDSFLGK